MLPIVFAKYFLLLPPTLAPDEMMVGNSLKNFLLIEEKGEDEKHRDEQERKTQKEISERRKRETNMRDDEKNEQL